SRPRTLSRRERLLDEREGDHRPEMPGAYGARTPDTSAFRRLSPTTMTLLPGGLFRVRCVQHGLAGGRHRRELDPVGQLRRRLRRLGLRMNDRILEPVGKLRWLAAVIAALVGLTVAVLVAVRAPHPDVEVI